MKGERIYSRAMLIDSKLYGESNLTVQGKRDLYNQFFKLIKKAAYLGHKDAMYEYAQQFEDISFLGVENPWFNPKKRNFWYHKAIEAGHPEAYNNLAYIYEIGEGVEKNNNKALEFYKKSAELGSVLGKKNYKIMLKDMSKGGRYNK
ncbi:tetratricopeptide repeat protein [Pedobacter hiemivivus]|uniref:Sel1 repeat family protein n=1 Tax=Pedobacter hiemivivus TaxID=2530454 RepID=A0A4R0NG90_9SPHI|nr:tetratricopeptide repeat protein [Pedobacter hiemivivus]TCC99445.1 sel1 repeat family protein [Pedobacter hiemivivus]